ncbi:MAG: ADP-ribosylglycohydrolase family protein [Deltaproteobacteria bacterium]|nr:MAG: ADP-ribosylglycohydrolase family protein [Deltaproteobacteria bacterium]
MTESNLEAKYLGSMVGSALGDAIGEMAFQYPDRQKLSAMIERLEVLRYTDDTAMAMGLATSLVHMGGLDRQHLGETFRRNFEQEPWRGYATGPPTIFSMVRSLGISYADAARSLFGGGGSFGNGAAMRISPLGLFFHKSSDIYQLACGSAEVTHAHPVGKDGAAVQAWAVALAVRLETAEGFSPQVFVDELAVFARTIEIQEKIRLAGRLLEENTTPDVAAKQLGRSVAVDESMPFAIYSFLRNPNSFEDCLYCAIMHGGDRDTLGAMAGAVSGAYLGVKAIPSGWRRKLENRETIEGLALELARKTLRT